MQCTIMYMYCCSDAISSSDACYGCMASALGPLDKRPDFHVHDSIPGILVVLVTLQSTVVVEFIILIGKALQTLPSCYRTADDVVRDQLCH